MGVPPSADAPALLNEAQEEAKNLPMGPQSNIAPVDNLAPLSPGNNVAPTHNHHKFGADKGNSFCLGQCFPSAEEAQCGPPYVSFSSILFMFYFAVSVLMSFHRDRFSSSLKAAILAASPPRRIGRVLKLV